MRHPENGDPQRSHIPECYVRARRFNVGARPVLASARERLRPRGRGSSRHEDHRRRHEDRRRACGLCRTQ